MLTKNEFEILNNAPLGATHFMYNIKSGESNYAVKQRSGILRGYGNYEYSMRSWRIEHYISDLRKQHEDDLLAVVMVNKSRAEVLSKISTNCIREMSEHVGSDAFVEYLKQLEQRDFTDKVKEIFKPHNHDLAEIIFNAMWDDQDLDELVNKNIIKQACGFKLASIATIECELDNYNAK